MAAKKYEGVEGAKAYAKMLIKMGYPRGEIYQQLLSLPSLKDLQQETKAEVVKEVVDNYKNYDLIQTIVRSELVCDFKSGERGNIIVVDSENRNIFEMQRPRLLELFDNKFDIKSQISTCRFEYMPYACFLIGKPENGIKTYNTYKPPVWQENYFYSHGLSKIPNSPLPKLYSKFFKHLVDNKQDSYDYLLKWMSNGIKSRNYCILTTIGNQGIGKGVLGTIMMELFGASNYHSGTDRMFKGTFNSQIEGKRFIYCDEISIKDKEEEDKVKLIVNDFIEIEQKGADVKYIKNYANFYLSSNSMDAISLTADDRRFSILDLTSTRLVDVMSSEEILQLFEPKNIEQLAHFLWNMEVSSEEMKKVFKSNRTEEVRDSTLKEWEEWWIYKYCAENKNKTLNIWEAGEAVKEQFGFNTRIGRSRFNNLSGRYPDVFKVAMMIEGDSRIWKVLIKDQK